MSDFFSKFHSDDLVMMIVVLGGMLFGLAAIIGGCVVKILKSNNQTKLKQEMIARGMSVDEIKAILEAGSKPPAIKIDWKK
jgi:hypothetical protein